MGPGRSRSASSPVQATFFVGDTLIDRYGGDNRKSSSGEQASGSPLAILLGTVLDGIPESIVLGLTIVQGGVVSAAMLAAVFLSNLPEAIAATSGLTRAGWSRGTRSCSGCSSRW